MSVSVLSLVCFGVYMADIDQELEVRAVCPGLGLGLGLGLGWG